MKGIFAGPEVAMLEEDTCNTNVILKNLLPNSGAHWIQKMQI